MEFRSFSAGLGFSIVFFVFGVQACAPAAALPPRAVADFASPPPASDYDFHFAPNGVKEAPKRADAPNTALRPMMSSKDGSSVMTSQGLLKAK